MRKLKKTVLITILPLSLLLNVILIANPLQADRESYHLYQQVFQNVFFYLKTMFVEETDEKELLIGAVRGMLRATKDPYTRFLDHEEHLEFNRAESGRKVGIGVEVTMRDEMPLVIAPIDGGPAKRAGIEAGDIITAIDGQATANRSFGEILKLIAGEIGEVVELEVKRRGESGPLKFQVVRGLFDIDYLKTSYIEEKKIGYLRLTQFFGSDSGVVDEFKQELTAFKNRGARGIIIDLRNNTGGHLEMAATLTGFFLEPDRVIATIRGRNNKIVKEVKSESATNIIPASLPVAVLINGGSASASEIMAGALQDYKRAVVVGSQSFGKASVQQIIRPLPDDTAALITIQKYYTPKNRALHGVGLKPDIVVDDITPTADEKYYLTKIEQSGLIEKFRKENPEYSAAVQTKFDGTVSKQGWKLSAALSKIYLRNRYGVRSGDIPDLELDPAMGRAVQELIAGANGN